MPTEERNSYIQLRDDEKEDLREAMRAEFGSGRAISQGAFVALLARRAMAEGDEGGETKSDTDESADARLVA